MLTQYETGFIEAFLDTDGSISLIKINNKYKTKFTLVTFVRFYNTSKLLLKKIQKIAGGNIISVTNKSMSKMGFKPNFRQFYLQLNQNEIISLFSEIILILKDNID